MQEATNVATEADAGMRLAERREIQTYFVIVIGAECLGGDHDGRVHCSNRRNEILSLSHSSKSTLTTAP